MAHRAKRVLVVDDNPVNLEIVAEILSEGYQLRFAESGELAVQIARTFKPQVILLDVMMPDLDGLETCRQLRRIPDLKSCAIIMVSAKAMPSERAAGLRAGANDYITKPFDEVELVEKVRRHFTRSGSDQQDEMDIEAMEDQVIAVF